MQTRLLAACTPSLCLLAAVFLALQPSASILALQPSASVHATNAVDNVNSLQLSRDPVKISANMKVTAINELTKHPLYHDPASSPTRKKRPIALVSAKLLAPPRTGITKNPNVPTPRTPPSNSRRASNSGPQPAVNERTPGQNKLSLTPPPQRTALASPLSTSRATAATNPRNRMPEKSIVQSKRSSNSLKPPVASPSSHDHSTPASEKPWVAPKRPHIIEPKPLKRPSLQTLSLKGPIPLDLTVLSNLFTRWLQVCKVTPSKRGIIGRLKNWSSKEVSEIEGVRKLKETDGEYIVELPTKHKFFLSVVLAAVHDFLLRFPNAPLSLPGSVNVAWGKSIPKIPVVTFKPAKQSSQSLEFYMGGKKLQLASKSDRCKRQLKVTLKFVESV